MGNETLLDVGKRIKAIADTGLLYSKDGFDKERYHGLKLIGEKIIYDELKIPAEKAASLFNDCIDYPTPKVDIRALVLNEKKEILMVQEKADKCWSLPGGWADIGKTASENAMQEVFEETGLQVACKYLAAVYDKRMHPHPPQPWYVYKMVFYCEAINNNYILKPAFDVLDVGWFDIDLLPSLSTDRILESQVKTIYQNIIHKNFITIFD